MELQIFEEIRQSFCEKHPEITIGKMMSSPAIHHRGKVFAFFSRKQRMVFKLGKDYPLNRSNYPLTEFNPFKTKGPLSGWYELPFMSKLEWKEMTLLALSLNKK